MICWGGQFDKFCIQSFPNYGSYKFKNISTVLLTIPTQRQRLCKGWSWIIHLTFSNLIEQLIHNSIDWKLCRECNNQINLCLLLSIYAMRKGMTWWYHIPVEIFGCSGGSERMNEWTNKGMNKWMNTSMNMGRCPPPKKVNYTSLKLT